MSQVSPGGGSRPSNGTNPANGASGPETGVQDSRSDDLPTPEERLAEMVREYPDRSFRPLADRHGTRLRAEAMAEPEQQEREVQVGENETATVAEVVEQSALPWVAVVEEFLEWYEGYRDKFLRMAKGREGRPEYESFLVPMENSFSPVYNEREFARLRSLERETVGGKRPSGGESVGRFDEPYTVLLTLSTSSMEEGEYRPPLEHDREIREAWGGTDGVRRTLRYVMRERLGLSNEDYVIRRQSEPHASGGDATGYGHDHIAIVFDGAECDRPPTQEEFRRVVDKHVEECPYAEPDAHGAEAIELNEPDEVGDLASYLAAYISTNPEDDLLERPIEYIMWAATQWASTSQKFSQSNSAGYAIEADACKQRYEDEEANQDRRHAEKVMKSDKPGYDFECLCCGSPWEVDQSPETLTEARLATDGGDGDAGRSGALKPGATFGQRWPSARSGGRVAEPVHGADEDVDVSVTVDGFDRPPRWRAEAVVHRDRDEEHLLGAPGGVEYGEVVVRGVGSIASQIDFALTAEMLKGPEPWKGSDVLTEEMVRTGAVPPPELVSREWAEWAQSGRQVTPKKWQDDWYAERYEREESGTVEFDRDAVAEYVRLHPEASVVEVMGACRVPPPARESVESLVAAV